MHIAPVVLFRVRVLRGVGDATWISAFLSAVPQRLPWTTMVGNGHWRYSAVLKADGAGCRRRQTIDASAIPRFCGTARRKWSNFSAVPQDEDA